MKRLPYAPRFMHSLRGRFVLATVSATIIALLVAAIALVGYDVHTYRNRALAELGTQADILGAVSAGALLFNDVKGAHSYLSALAQRPSVRAAALYRADGSLFAQYLAANASPDLIPATAAEVSTAPPITDARVFHGISFDHEAVGSLLMIEKLNVRERLRDTLSILCLALAAGVVATLSVTAWLQKGVIGPVLTVAEVAREVMQKRDFSLRAPRGTANEIGILIDAFNDMLSEIGRRSAELQAAVVALQKETGEREAAQRALQLADQRKDEFLATLAHELRNPLAPLRNSLAILRLSNDTQAQLKAREIMERQLAQMVRLIDDLLDVSRITTGKLVLKREPMQLQQVIEAAVESVRPAMERKHQQFTLSVPARAIELNADSTRLAQVFTNLLHNSSKYSDEAGAIALTVKLQSTEVAIDISDNGIGIDAEKLPLVFEMFAQVDTSLERSQGGLGVGLALAQRLVHMHGGRLSVYSAGLGQGACFTVTLPLVNTAADA